MKKHQKVLFIVALLPWLFILFSSVYSFIFGVDEWHLFPVIDGDIERYYGFTAVLQTLFWFGVVAYVLWLWIPLLLSLVYIVWFIYKQRSLKIEQKYKEEYNERD
ncbi:hypothetical protein FACS1894132_00980 [Clostridia bacterium]|nr:hypothetical protein FACS1894132_00980 [Clostridia bacterium]